MTKKHWSRNFPLLQSFRTKLQAGVQGILTEVNVFAQVFLNELLSGILPPTRIVNCNCGGKPGYLRSHVSWVFIPEVSRNAHETSKFYHDLQRNHACLYRHIVYISTIIFSSLQSYDKSTERENFPFSTLMYQKL